MSEIEIVSAVKKNLDILIYDIEHIVLTHKKLVESPHMMMIQLEDRLRFQDMILVSISDFLEKTTKLIL